MSVTVTGVKELSAALKRLGIDATKAVKQGVGATAQQVRNTAIKSITTVSSGETVTRYKQGGTPYEHTSSKAGDAPNTDTGALIRSVAIEQQQPESALVGSGLDYALFLEAGTRNMQARPWLQPALDANIKNLPENISKIIQRLIK